MSGPLLDPMYQGQQIGPAPSQPSQLNLGGRGASATAKIFKLGTGQHGFKKPKRPGSQISHPSKGQHS